MPFARLSLNHSPWDCFWRHWKEAESTPLDCIEIDWKTHSETFKILKFIQEFNSKSKNFKRNYNRGKKVFKRNWKPSWQRWGAVWSWGERTLLTFHCSRLSLKLLSSHNHCENTEWWPWSFRSETNQICDCEALWLKIYRNTGR